MHTDELVRIFGPTVIDMLVGYDGCTVYAKNGICWIVMNPDGPPTMKHGEIIAERIGTYHKRGKK